MTTRPTQSSAVRLGFDPAYLADFEGRLFIEGPTTRRKLMNFFALLLFATVIATYGVLSGSIATVIGAMIVAPLRPRGDFILLVVVKGHLKAFP